jgi:hypothetical protein
MADFAGFLFGIVSKEKKNKINAPVRKAPLLSRKGYNESDLKAMSIEYPCGWRML